MAVTDPQSEDISPLGTRSVVGPDGSLYVAGQYSRYNADPTQIPADNPLPPIRPPGYVPWQPPPELSQTEKDIQTRIKDLAAGPLNERTIQESMRMADAAQQFLEQRSLQNDLQRVGAAGGDISAVYREHIPRMFRTNPKVLGEFMLQQAQPKAATPQPTYVPANPQTGAPAMMVTPKGDPRFIPQIKPPSKEKISEAQKKLMEADTAELKSIEKKKEAMNIQGHTLFHPFVGNTPEAQDLDKRAAALRAKIAAYDPVQSRSPHAEGTILRKKDGSRWVVQNGIPVPFEKAQSQVQAPAGTSSSDEEADTEE